MSSSDGGAKTKNNSAAAVAIDLSDERRRRRPQRPGGSEKEEAERARQVEPGALASFFGALTRKKPLDCSTETRLDRCLNLLDLTTLGVGSTLGLGLYVLAGQVACNKAGPAVILSFALAALASAFSALCYAEFAGRVPCAGSAYAYSYITMGEFVAFIIGWNLILEYVIGASSVARGFSGYLRFVFAHIKQNLVSLGDTSGQVQTGATLGAPPLLSSSAAAANQSFTQPLARLAPMTHLEGNLSAAAAASNLAPGVALSSLASSSSAAATGVGVGGASLGDIILDYLVRYFDWPSIAIVLVLTVFILFGVKESTNVALVFTATNMLVVVTVVLSSLSSLDLHNWQLTKEELPEGGQHGEGGFLPFGWSGVLAGSATCFFGFIGFDTIASSAEEAKNPKRNVPLAIVLSLFISFLAYMSVALVQTLLWPYYDQDNVTILPYIFNKLNMPVTYWIVLLGAVAGLSSSQLGGMYPLPRILYSMAQDRLIYGSLARVNRRLKLPVRATLVGAFFIALLACLLDIQDLADMVSIGTLAAYSLVSVSVLIVRYENRRPSSQVEACEQLPSFGHLNNRNFDGAQTLVGQLASGGRKQMKKQQKPGQLDEKKAASLERRAGEACERQAAAPGLLDLLNTWRSIEDPTKREPDDRTAGQSRLLIGTIILLTILLDLLALGLFESRPASSSTGSGQQQQQQQHMLARLMLEQPYLQSRLVLSCTSCILLFALAAAGLMLSRLPTSSGQQQADMFLVPLVPLVPILSIFVNTFLMLNLSYLTWLRFTIWMSIGFFIYFSYGIWHGRGHLKMGPPDAKRCLPVIV